MNMKKSLTTSTVTKGLKKNLKAILKKHSITSLQKAATLGTSNVIENYCSLKLGIKADIREVSVGKCL